MTNSPSSPVTISPSDPLVIIAGIRRFGLASDGSDLRDLEAAIASLDAAARAPDPIHTEDEPEQDVQQ